MTDPDANLSPAEAAFADQLAGQRPVLAPVFRGALGRHLLASDPHHGPRPAHLRAVVSLAILCGAVVLLVALLQALGTL